MIKIVERGTIDTSNTEIRDEVDRYL